MGEQNLQKGAKRLLSVCAIVLSVTVLAIPFGALMGAIGTTQGATVSTLRIGFLQKVDSMNPYVGINDAAYIFYGLVYDALEVIDNKMQPSPDLAVSQYPVPTSDPKMQVSGEPYGSVWQYNLTHNAKWTDGEYFTADDVVWNIELNANNYQSMWAYQPYSYYMKFAEKIDDYTVRIHFYDQATGNSIPCAYAYILSIPMLPKHKLLDMPPSEIGFKWRGVYENETNTIVGTGPFMGSKNIYRDWVSGNSITLVRNPNYHWALDRQPAAGEAANRWDIKFDQIQFKFFDEPLAMSYSLKNKQIDVAAFPPAAYRAIANDVSQDKLANVTTFDGPKITQYWTEIAINQNNAGPNPSRLDPVIRHAMAMATNKSYIVENNYFGLADVGTTLIPPINKFWHYNLTDSELIKFNMQAAKDSLQAAGYIDTDSDGIREATSTSYAAKAGLVTVGTPLQYEMLVRREYPEERDIAYWLQTQWREIGIDLEPSIIDETTLNTVAYLYAYDTFIWYWSADIDPNYQLNVQTTAAINGWNDNAYSNASYDENYSLSVRTLDKELRKGYVDNCQRIDYEDTYYIIMAYVHQTYAWRTDTFGGWGDWVNDPGRSVDNFWMGNPLYFDLYPKDVGSTTTLNWPLIGGAIGAVAVVAAVVVVFMMRGNKKRKEGGGKESESPLGD